MIAGTYERAGLPIPAFVSNHRRPSPEWVAARRSGLAARRRSHRPPTLQEYIRDYWVPILGAASSVTITLDTTAPGGVTLAINAGAPYATARAVTANIACSDADKTGYTMKVWGDVDTTVNANIQATQGASAWIAYSAAQAVTLSIGDGSKTLNIVVRDDVGNATGTVSDTITLDTVVPVVAVQGGSPTAAKISEIAGFDTSQVTWQSDSIYQAYEVAVVSSSGSLRGTGTVLGTGGGSTNVQGAGLSAPASTNVTTTIKGLDLATASPGDGSKVVKVFVQDLAGNWSL